MVPIWHSQWNFWFTIFLYCKREKLFSFEQYSNSDHQSKSHARWPHDLHHKGLITNESLKGEIVVMLSVFFHLSMWSIPLAKKIICPIGKSGIEMPSAKTTNLSRNFSANYSNLSPFIQKLSSLLINEIRAETNQLTDNPNAFRNGELTMQIPPGRRLGRTGCSSCQGSRCSQAPSSRSKIKTFLLSK